MFSSLGLSVLVPSYRRPTDLSRCLVAISGQTTAPSEVIVVTRANDVETIKVCESCRAVLELTILMVNEPGQVHALNAGLARCISPIVAIVDDDAAPRPDWLARIEAHFRANPHIGGVGGRDWLYNDGIVENGQRRKVGVLLWFGRIVGDHHLGVGPAREVDILKGANCAFLRKAIQPIGFDTRLRGTGAQVHNDMAVCLAVKRAGWQLIYDPNVAVDHYLGKRHDPDQRGVLNRNAVYDRAFNLRLALGNIYPVRLRVAAELWQLLVGTRDAPGIIWLSRLLISRRPNAWIAFLATRLGWREAAVIFKKNVARNSL